MIAKKSYYKKSEKKSLSKKTIEILRAKLKSKAYIDFAIDETAKGLAEALINEGEVKRKEPKEILIQLDKTKREKIREYVERIRCLCSTKKKISNSEQRQLTRTIMRNYKNRHNENY